MNVMILIIKCLDSLDRHITHSIDYRVLAKKEESKDALFYWLRFFKVFKDFVQYFSSLLLGSCSQSSGLD